MNSLSIFTRTLFSSTGLLIAVYIIIGVFANTAAPHIPHNTGDLATTAHSWTQYFISVIGWPLSFWHPTITVSKWTP